MERIRAHPNELIFGHVFPRSPKRTLFGIELHALDANGYIQMHSGGRRCTPRNFFDNLARTGKNKGKS